MQSLFLGASYVVFAVFSQASASVKTPYDRNGEIAYMNIQESRLGFELDLNQTKYLVSNSSTASDVDCELKCLEKVHCLSGISVRLTAVSYRCLLFNWSTTDFEKRLAQKTDTRSFQLLTATCHLNNPCKNGGECIANTGPYNYVCNCTNGYAGRNCSQKCVLFDFESGRLDEWVLTGTVFNNQPTYGDNSKARSRETSNLSGNWWIGGAENRPGPSYPAGQIQGDIPVGTMLSPPFIIKGSTLKFRVGGGTNINLLHVELLVEGVVVKREASAQFLETMNEKTINVTSYRNKVSQLRVVDNDQGAWGHINVDHFEDMICTQ